MGNKSSNKSVDNLNSNISNLNNKIIGLQNDIRILKTNVDGYKEDVSKSFENIDSKVTIYQEQVQTSFNTLNSGFLEIQYSVQTINTQCMNLEISNKQDHIDYEYYMCLLAKRNKILSEFQKMLELKFMIESDIKTQDILLLKDSVDLMSKNQLLMIEAINTGDHSNLKLIKYDRSTYELEKRINNMALITEKLLTLEDLENKFQLLICNNPNKNLLDPLDESIKPKQLATQLYEFGVKATTDINENSLNSCGFNDVVEFRYPTLIQNFIEGSELCELVLDWEKENLDFFSNYLYNKVQFKSINAMLEFAKSTKCIYRVLDSQLTNCGTVLWSYCNSNSLTLDLQYENPMIFNKILQENHATNELVTNELVSKYGYKPIGWMALNRIQHIDNTELLKLKIIDNQNSPELVKILKHIYSDIINQKFKFDKKKELIEFLLEVIKKFLVKYEECLEYYNDVTKINPEYDSKIMNPVLCLDKNQNQVLMKFVTSKILDYYWNVF
jgi:outer membrane murein-binding lipoprotein Lpp